MPYYEGDPQRVLDFDLENRPLSYLGQDWTSAEITSIAWSWVGKNKVWCFLLHREGSFVKDGEALAVKHALAYFGDVLARADTVTGHNIRKHDLPLLNGAMMEYGLPPLPPLMVQDTLRDLMRRKDLSASQENLASMFGLPEPKHHMTQSEWRKANRLTPDGMKATRKRVTSDVLQHKALRLELLKRGLLNAPRMWTP